MKLENQVVFRRSEAKHYVEKKIFEVFAPKMYYGNGQKKEIHGTENFSNRNPFWQYSLGGGGMISANYIIDLITIELVHLPKKILCQN